MQTIYLDISNKGVIPCIMAKQSEVGRKFLAVITDNGKPYDIPVHSLLSVWYEGTTDAGNYSSIEERSAFEIDGNQVSVELVAQMLLNPGNGELCLSITHGDGGETNTWNIPYEVEYKPGAGSHVPTEYYTALTEAGSFAAEQAGIAKEQADRIVATENKLTGIENILVPVGYTFHWSPVENSNVDLSTPEKVASHFGFGVWRQIEDTFLYGAGPKHAVGETGGKETQILTVDQMPQHTHNAYFAEKGGTENGWGYSFSNEGGKKAGGVLPSSTGILYSGNSQPFSIMPTYLSVYIWQRIA